MKKNIALFILLISFCSFSVFNKNYFAELVEEKLDEYSSSFSPEKIYIHTDKPFYGLDETIWYTSYLVDGITHEKAEKSWVIHVELFDEQDSIVSKKRLFTNLYSVGGDIKIDKNWKPGKYLLRAYTNYMRNNNPDYFFKKEINIWDVDKLDSLSITLNKNSEITENKIFKQIKPDLHFYPEGGHLIENVRSKVAIKMKNIGLDNVRFSGVIVNDKDEVISDFQTVEFGLSIFTLSPKPSVSYFAKLEVNGVEYKYELPKALQNGFSLSALNTGSNIIVNAASNTPTGLLNTYLVAHQRGKLVLSKFQKEQTNNYTFKIPTTALKDGVMHLTLFDATGNPVNERLVFVSNKNDKGFLEIKKTKEVLSNRKEQVINIITKDHNGNVLPSYLSMSIRDLNAFPYNRFDMNIKTYLLLNSDLRGAIKSPGYFFDGEFTKKKQYLLDLVMLTNGWRRFTWRNLLFKKKKNLYNPEKGIYISGKTQRLKKPYGPISTATRLTFYGENNIAQEPTIKTNEIGEFSFGPFIFFDSIQTIVESRITDFKSKNEKDREVLILVNQNKNESPELNRNNIKEEVHSKDLQLEIFSKVSKYIRELNEELDQKIQKLDEVTVIANIEEAQDERQEQMNNSTDYGYPSNRLDLETDYVESGQTIFDLLNTIPGVNAYNDSITIRQGTGAPLILLDKFPVEVDFLQSIMAAEVSFVDILKGADAAFYPRGANGVVAIYTKTGYSNIYRNVKRKPGIIDFAAEGFYTAKEFYSPDHITSFDAVTPDIRTTLHWEPKITINSEFGKDISFFTCDSDSDYIIEVQGISESGIPLYGTSTFSVE